MERRNIVIFFILLICGICILLSQNFWAQGAYVYDILNWTSYEVSPGDWRYVSFQDSFMGQLFPALGYLPAIVAGLVLLGAVIIFASVRASKISCIISGILTIVVFFIYILPSIFLAIVGSILPFPNEMGAYLFLIPGIMALILAFLIKRIDYGKDEARVDREYYAIGGEPRRPAPPSTHAPTIACPNCGAMLAADALFCESCGQYL